ncbi:beta-lactamase-like protein [Dioszegia hungarica]|uniref:Beta-lactamase-like protein n=1 Tax=Dioszegia hungarica TaxID=4972 RepID=A0AA38HEK1_9TREE|nr:beta-lactamase-like protein [Dioszegia hungarica]KAI9637849.1 beta-lactamase-like protein [Dioszegia hungarica]
MVTTVYSWSSRQAYPYPSSYSTSASTSTPRKAAKRYTSTMATQPRHSEKARMLGHHTRLSDVVKLSAHVTRILGQNPGQMTLQGTNSYLLQPPSSPYAPLILIDTSSPHTASQYVDLVVTHLHHLALEAGLREVHFESDYAVESLGHLPTEADMDEAKIRLLAERAANPRAHPEELGDQGPEARWVFKPNESKMPAVEHIILTHRHLDHVGALPALLEALAKLRMPPPRIWKLPSPDELELTLSDKDRPTTDAVIVNTLPHGLYTPFSPFQPLHPIMPGLMISIIDPQYRHLLKHDKEGKPKWNEVPEIARVSVRCLKTPGHTQDSVSLVMCEGEKGVFTGDTVLGEGTTIFTDLSAYMLSLKTLLAIKPQTLYPGHGPHFSGPEASTAQIEAYIAHRQQREEQILALLLSLATDPSGPTGLQGREKEAEAKVKDAKAKGDDMPARASTPPPRKKQDEVEHADPRDEGVDRRHEKFEGSAVGLQLLTRLMYDTTSEKLIYAAQRPVLAHLEKLEKEGKVRRVTVQLPSIVEMVVSDEKEAVEGWEIVQGEDQ